MAERGFRRGFFHPTHPEKYLGDINRIVFRSSWEIDVFQFLDRNTNVLGWQSEGLAINYLKPVPKAKNSSGVEHAVYIPDLFVIYKDRNSKIIKELIEVKPKKQSLPSTSKKESVRLQENYVYLVNRCKWAAAKKWCEKYGVNFRLVTEDQLARLKL